MEFNDKERVERMLNTGQVPGGCYIFQGVKGLGKCSAALKLADKILGQSAVTHPDFYFLKPEEGVIGVDHVSRMRDFVSYVSVASERKVIIIDDADKMTIPAQNAILKMLEEQTGSNLFLLVAHDSLISTIRSRSVTIPFCPLSEEDMKTLYPEADDCLLTLAKGRPGVLESYRKDSDFLTDCMEVFHCLSVMTQKRDLMEAFHLIKEKDKENFFEKYDTDKVSSFLESLRDVFMHSLVRESLDVCDVDHLRKVYSYDEHLAVMDKITESLNLMQRKGLYNKNDFFDFVRVMM